MHCAAIWCTMMQQDDFWYFQRDEIPFDNVLHKKDVANTIIVVTQRFSLIDPIFDLASFYSTAEICWSCSMSIANANRAYRPTFHSLEKLKMATMSQGKSSLQSRIDRSSRAGQHRTFFSLRYLTFLLSVSAIPWVSPVVAYCKVFTLQRKRQDEKQRAGLQKRIWLNLNFELIWAYELNLKFNLNLRKSKNASPQLPTRGEALFLQTFSDAHELNYFSRESGSPEGPETFPQIGKSESLSISNAVPLLPRRRPSAPPRVP